jgi:DNA polymerase-4
MIFHIDMDAFYAAVEQRDNPQLRGQCVIVGGTSNRGVVSAASYEARAFGIHSAMPMFKARKKCPQGVCLLPRMKRYKEVSEQVMAVLRGFSPLVEPVSIDEAYMDVTGCETLFGTPEQMGKQVKQAVWDAVGLTCSVGIAPLRFLAKIASDIQKPDGLHIIAADQMSAFIDRLPIEKVPGVGRTTRSTLLALGLPTLGAVRSAPQQQLVQRLGKFGHRLVALAHGRDETRVTPLREHKSAGSERTLGHDTHDRSLLKSVLLEQCEDVARELRRLKVKARVVTIKVKFSDFRQITRRATLPVPARASDVLYRQAECLLNGLAMRRAVRLIGVAGSGFVDGRAPVQQALFPSDGQPGGDWERIDRVVDDIQRRFGKHTIHRANVKDR